MYKEGKRKEEGRISNPQKCDPSSSNLKQCLNFFWQNKITYNLGFTKKKSDLLCFSLSNYAPMKRCTLNFDGLLSKLFANFWLSNSEFDSFTKKFCKESKSKILKTLNRARLVFWHISTLSSQDLDFQVKISRKRCLKNISSSLLTI